MPLGCISRNETFFSTPSAKPEYIHNFTNIFKISDYYNNSTQNKNLEWMFKVENTEEFIRWFCTYIGPENVLRDDEINEYLELTAAGILDLGASNQNPSNDELSSSVEITDESVNALEEEILELDTFFTVLNNQEKSLRSMCKQVDDEVLGLQEKSKSEEQQILTNELACKNGSKQLDFARASFMECFIPLNCILNNSSMDQPEHLQLLSHMPIKDFTTKYDRSDQHINFITSRNHLEQVQQMPADSNDSSSQFTGYENKTILRKTMPKLTCLSKLINRAMDTFFTAHVDKQENLAAVCHVTALVSDIQNGLFQPSQNKLRIQLENFKIKLEDFVQTSLLLEILSANQRFTNASVMQVFHKLGDKALRQQNNSFKCRQMLLNCVKARVCHCYLFLVLLFDEKQKLNDLPQLSIEYAEPLSEEFHQLTVRREQMKMVRRGLVQNSRDGKEMCENKYLPKTLLSLVPPQTSYKHLFDAFKDLDQGIYSNEQVLIYTSFNDVEETLTKNEKSLQELVKILFSGPTKKPVIVDLDLSCQLYDMDLLVNGLKKRLAEVIAECEITKANMSTIEFRTQRLLWVYFLTDCEKIDCIIANMEKRLANMEKCLGDADA